MHAAQTTSKFVVYLCLISSCVVRTTDEIPRKPPHSNIKEAESKFIDNATNPTDTKALSTESKNHLFDQWAALDLIERAKISKSIGKNLATHKGELTPAITAPQYNALSKTVHGIEYVELDITPPKQAVNSYQLRACSQEGCSVRLFGSERQFFGLPSGKLLLELRACYDFEDVSAKQHSDSVTGCSAATPKVIDHSTLSANNLARSMLQRLDQLKILSIDRSREFFAFLYSTRNDDNKLVCTKKLSEFVKHREQTLKIGAVPFAELYLSGKLNSHILESKRHPKYRVTTSRSGRVPHQRHSFDARPRLYRETFERFCRQAFADGSEATGYTLCVELAKNHDINGKALGFDMFDKRPSKGEEVDEAQYRAGAILIAAGAFTVVLSATLVAAKAIAKRIRARRYRSKRAPPPKTEISPKKVRSDTTAVKPAPSPTPGSFFSRHRTSILAATSGLVAIATGVLLKEFALTQSSCPVGNYLKESSRYAKHLKVIKDDYHEALEQLIALGVRL